MAVVARGQPETISTDLPEWTGSVTTFSGAGSGSSQVSLGEALTGVIAIESVTYTFVSSTLSSNVGGTLDAALVQWNQTNNTYTTVQSLSPVSINAPDTWTDSISYNNGNASTYSSSVTFDLSFTNTANLTPADAYVVLLSNTSSQATTFGLGTVNAALTGPYVGNLADGVYTNAANTRLVDPTTNWTFSSISAVPVGNVVPSAAPESGTIAAMAGVVLVAGLVVYRMRQRREASVRVA